MTHSPSRRASYSASAYSFAALAVLSVSSITACTEDPQPSGAAGGAGAGPSPTAGSGGGNTAGAGMAGAGGGAGTAGSAGAQTGSAGGGSGGGSTTMAPACKPVTQVNGSGLTLNATDINAFKYAPAAGAEMVKMAYDPVGKVVVILSGNGSMVSFDPTVALPTTAMTSPVTTTMPYNSGYKADDGYGMGFAAHRGIAFDNAGNLYVLAVRGGNNVGVNIKKGVAGAAGAPRTWTTIATTSTGFPASGTDYDHTFSGIAVSPDQMSLLISSGSRTEHGEVRGGVREVPLSSAIFKVPVNGMTDLKNDEAALMPFLYADGLRNAFDLAFNAAGELIGTENGPDMDLPDEINHLEQGKNYGFPWRFGDVDNPTRDAAYSREGDKRLQPGYGAINSYVADTDFPPAPGAFTDPIRNLGPDANYLRAGRDAATPTKAGPEGLAGVTGHRSPLGLAFDVEGKLCGDYWKEGFVLSYGALVPASFNDPGEDLLLIRLSKGAMGYTMTAKQIAKGIKAPMDSVLVGNRLFTIGFGNAAQIFVFELPTPAAP